MSEYSKLLEKIKLSEITVAAITKEIKDVETEIKTVDKEIEIMKAKEKQINEELTYKKRIVNDKEWEVQSLKRCHEIWKNMLEEKRKILDLKTEELSGMHQNVWDTRISFYDRTMDFLTKNDLLFNYEGNIENIQKKQREKSKIIEAVNNLENILNNTEEEHRDAKDMHDLLDHLNKEKETLLKYEQSPDIIRMQVKIDNYKNELEALDFELMKYSENTGMQSHGGSMVKAQQIQYYTEDKRSENERIGYFESENENFEEISDYEKKKVFKPKVPSFLLTGMTLPGED